MLRIKTLSDESDRCPVLLSFHDIGKIFAPPLLSPRAVATLRLINKATCCEEVSKVGGASLLPGSESEDKRRAAQSQHKHTNALNIKQERSV